MEAEHFDSLTKRLADLQSRRRLLGGALRGIVVGAAVAVTGASLGLPETEAKKKAKAGRKQGVKTAKKTEPKVTICHEGKTTKVDESAVPAHLRHGDTLGPCKAPPPPICAGTCSRKNPCGPGCVCLDTGGVHRRCLAQGTCSGIGDCGSGTCGAGCTCVNPGGRKTGCVSVVGCPAGRCTSNTDCGSDCVCVGVGNAARCASRVPSA